MLSAFLSRIIILVFGTLYPAYASYKAVKTKNLKEYVKWMMYWIVFALFICVETFADILLAFWMPLYYEIKIIFLFWLLSPWTKGSSCLYRKFVHPELSKRERDIDDMVAKARAQGYSTLVNYGAKGLTLASKFVAEIAIKGQYTLMNQLRKSQSLNDISPHHGHYLEDVETDENANGEGMFISKSLKKNSPFKSANTHKIGSKQLSLPSSSGNYSSVGYHLPPLNHRPDRAFYRSKAGSHTYNSNVGQQPERSNTKNNHIVYYRKGSAPLSNNVSDPISLLDDDDQNALQHILNEELMDSDDLIQGGSVTFDDFDNGKYHINNGNGRGNRPYSSLRLGQDPIIEEVDSEQTNEDETESNSSMPDETQPDQNLQTDDGNIGTRLSSRKRLINNNSNMGTSTIKAAKSSVNATIGTRNTTRTLRSTTEDSEYSATVPRIVRRPKTRKPLYMETQQNNHKEQVT